MRDNLVISTEFDVAGHECLDALLDDDCGQLQFQGLDFAHLLLLYLLSGVQVQTASLVEFVALVGVRVCTLLLDQAREAVGQVLAQVGLLRVKDLRFWYAHVQILIDANLVQILQEDLPVARVDVGRLQKHFQVLHVPRLLDLEQRVYLEHLAFQFSHVSLHNLVDLRQVVVKALLRKLIRRISIHQIQIHLQRVDDVVAGRVLSSSHQVLRLKLLVEQVFILLGIFQGVQLGLTHIAINFASLNKKNQIRQSLPGGRARGVSWLCDAVLPSTSCCLC